MVAFLLVLAAAGADMPKVFFASTRHNGDHELYVMNLDGSAQTRLTFRSTEDTSPSAHPSGRSVSFHSHLLQGNGNVHVLNLLTSAETIPTSDSPLHDTRPAWSPDGKYIAYSSDINITTGDIYRMNADGSGKVNLTNTPNEFNSHPTWSPDGQYIVFLRHVNLSNYEIMRMKWDGSEVVNLTNNSFSDGEPSYSPDGTKILFNSSRNGNNYDIFIMNADGSNPTPLTSHPAREWFSSFTPDMSKIVYASNETGIYQVYSMNPDGSGKLQLTTEGWNETPRCEFRGLLVRPTSHTLFRGFEVSGNNEAAMFQDDVRWAFRPGSVPIATEAPIQLILSGISEVLDPTSVQVTVESSVSTANILLTVHLYDFDAGAYVLAHSGAAQTSDGHLLTSTLTDADRFVEDSTGQIRAKLSWRATGAVSLFPWQARVDFFGWLVK